MASSVASAAGASPTTTSISPIGSVRRRRPSILNRRGNPGAESAYTYSCRSVSRRIRQDAVGGTEQRGQSDVDEIDVGQRENQVGIEHDTAVQQVVEDVEQRRIGLIDD